MKDSNTGDSIQKIPIAFVGIAIGFALILVIESIAIYTFGLSEPDGYWVGALTSIPVIALLAYAGYWLHSSWISEDRYLRILWWAIGFLSGFFLLILVILQQTETLSELYLLGTFRWAGSLGAAIGMVIGISEARAIERAREAATSKAIEETLRQERNLLEAAFEAIPNPVIHARFGEEGPVVINMNDEIEEVFGFDETDLKDHTLDDLLVPEDCSTEATELNQTLAAEGFVEAEVRRNTATGIRPFLVSAKTMEVNRGDEERIEGIAAYVDLTEQKRREAELVRQNDRLDAFTSVVSHDLRNPLNVATGRLELAKDECDSEHLTEVERSLQRMESLIEDLLELARHGEAGGEREPVEVAAVIERCWANVETSGGSLETDLSKTVLADKSRFKQLFENLFRNAIEHGGDSVTVRMGELSDGLYVEDNGPGIPEADRSDVFTPGYSSHDEGTGFGLSIVKEIVEAHGWEITITEGSEGGARFEITGVESV